MQYPVPTLLAVAFGLSEAGLTILKRSRDDSVDTDDSTLRVLWATILAAISVGIVMAQRYPAAAMGHLRAVTFWAGCALFGIGLALRWYAIVYLGRYFTMNVAIHSGHEVVDS